MTRVNINKSIVWLFAIISTSRSNTWCGNVSAFSAPSTSLIYQSTLPTKRIESKREGNKKFANPPLFPATTRIDTQTTTALHFSLATVPEAFKSASKIIPFPPAVKKAFLAAFAFSFIVLQRRRIFYPGSLPDRSFQEPLPPGPINGCPFIGNISQIRNINDFLYQTSSKLGSPKIWKYYGFSKPIAVLSGSALTKRLLNREFKKENGVSQITSFGNSDKLFGTESMSTENQDKDKYHFLRRLVGKAMTPEAVAMGIPAIQSASENIVNHIVSSDQVAMEKMCKHLTLDVAWRQMIGLNFRDEEEVQDFHDAVQIWMTGLISSFYMYLPLPGVKLTKTYKAKQYLSSLIERKIDDLERNGPDGSTLSAMVFAVDDENQSKRLNRQQIIDNTLLLIVAGSETSANTLTNTMLLLGMHPEAWDKLVTEQDKLVAKHGTQLTKDQIDDECPYLEAVVKESMRILPISGGGIRSMDETTVMDGLQLPKKWWVMYSPYLTHDQDPITWKKDGSHMDIKLGFKPERWLDESTRPTTEFIPFGAGHRFCLGHTIAMAEMKTFLAVMARKLKHFDLLTNVDQIRWKEGVILTPEDGVVIAPRKN